MSILEFSNLKYTYNGKQSILRGASGKLEQGKLYANRNRNLRYSKPM